MWWQAGSFVFTKWTQLTNSIQEDSKSLGIPKALFFFCFFFYLFEILKPTGSYMDTEYLKASMGSEEIHSVQLETVHIQYIQHYSNLGGHNLCLPVSHWSGMWKWMVSFKSRHPLKRVVHSRHLPHILQVLPVCFQCFTIQLSALPRCLTLPGLAWELRHQVATLGAIIAAPAIVIQSFSLGSDVFRPSGMRYYSAKHALSAKVFPSHC